MKTEIDQLKENIFSEDWELVKSSADKLGKIGGEEVVNFLISLLLLDDSGIRDRAALALEDIKDNRAVEPLLNAIFKKENHNYNGTLVFALESLDCSEKLKEIFRILIYESYEAKMGADTILSEQMFDFNEEDLIEIQEMWNDCRLNPGKCSEFEESMEMIQSNIDSFMIYLKNKE